MPSPYATPPCPGPRHPPLSRRPHLQSAHVRPLLAEPLGPVLAVAHAHDVARADQIGDVGLEGRALAEGARAEPRHGPREPRHVAVHDVGPGEVWAERGRAQQNGEGVAGKGRIPPQWTPSPL